MLQIEDQRIGARFKTARQLPLAVGRDEQKRTHRVPHGLGCDPCRITFYLLASRKHGTLYLGVTNDIVRRVHEHKSKAAAGFASKYGVDRLVWFECHDEVVEAILREKEIKKWRRDWKINLIERDNPDWLDLWEAITR
ncbi:MAG TPA: GIY-YIG nuclease family protein [Stellaceae bacterium]|nr:GIY-YIG nuclease family protein [Stellaceae bacterium]